MDDIIQLTSELFAAYGREANEDHIRAYSTILRNGKSNFICQAIIRACSGEYERLPTAAQIMRLAIDIEKEHLSERDKNQTRYEQIRASYVQSAIKAGWSLYQRDELIELCEIAFNSKEKRWRWSEQKLNDEVKILIECVRDYKQRCEEAKEKGIELPDEKLERWGWALPKDNQQESRDWDPAKESLWDHIKKCF